MALLGPLALAGCGDSTGVAASGPETGTGGGGAAAAPAGEAAVQPAPAGPPAKLSLAPADQAKDVAPGVPAKVTVTDGTLTEVKLANGAKQVAGTLAADKKSWTSTAPMEYDAAYTWTGSAVGADGKPVPVAGSFRTVKPGRQVEPTLMVKNGETYGVAMPIWLIFADPVKDTAAVERAVSVKTTPETEGAWSWVDAENLVWRPKAYWKPGTTATVEAKLFGVPHGGNAYGRKDLSATFTIGRKQVVKGNTDTHRLVVHDAAGKVLEDFPASFGAESDPKRVTRNGGYYVMSRHDWYLMKNPAYNYEFNAQWAVRISNHGEFVHSNPNTVGQQGRENVSHGCANLSPANAKKYFDMAKVGDPVEITGSSIDVPPVGSDFWSYPWNKWVAGSALR